jgi:hypothetical protein
MKFKKKKILAYTGGYVPTYGSITEPVSMVKK